LLLTNQGITEPVQFSFVFRLSWFNHQGPSNRPWHCGGVKT